MSTNDEIIAAVRQALADTPQQSQIIADITKTQALMAQQQEQILEMVRKRTALASAVLFVYVMLCGSSLCFA